MKKDEIIRKIGTHLQIANELFAQLQAPPPPRKPILTEREQAGILEKANRRRTRKAA